MSDDFDKEAERQRLREKYEQDKEDRESTERMSELLLQGATMTNRHCDTCGSPIFRYQGQEFCPTCQVQRANGEEGQAAQQGTAGGQGAGAGEPGQGAGDQPTQSPTTQPQSTADAPAQDPGEGRQGQPTSQSQPTAPSQHSAQSQPSARPGAAGGSAGDLDDASLEQVQASLLRTLATFAQRAAQTDDPHRAREYLQTAKEAAETLRALPR